MKAVFGYAVPLSTTYQVVAGVCAAQTATGAVTLTATGSLVSGGVATFDVARRVIITSGGNDSSIAFTITGTGRNGESLSEAVTGANAGAAQSTLDFKTVSSVVTSAATASQVQVGTNAVASGPWVVFDQYIGPRNVAVNVDVTSTTAINYTVEGTYDDMFSSGRYSSGPQLISITATNLASATADQSGVLTAPYTAVRLTRNSGVTAATVQFSVIQTGAQS